MPAKSLPKCALCKKPVTGKPVSEFSTGKIPKVQYGQDVWRDGKCLNADDARAFASYVHARFVGDAQSDHITHPDKAAGVACEPCAQAYYKRRDDFRTGTYKHTVTSAINVEALTASAQQNSLFTNEGYSTIRVGETEWRVTGAGAGYRARLRLKDNLELCACGHKASKHIDDGEGNLLHCHSCDCDHFWYAVPQTRNTDMVVLSGSAIVAEPTLTDKLEAMANDPRTNSHERIVATRKIGAILQKQAA
jgi:hypothetical protein